MTKGGNPTAFGAQDALLLVRLPFVGSTDVRGQVREDLLEFGGLAGAVAPVRIARPTSLDGARATALTAGGVWRHPDQRRLSNVAERQMGCSSKLAAHYPFHRRQIGPERLHSHEQTRQSLHRGRRRDREQSLLPQSAIERNEDAGARNHLLSTRRDPGLVVVAAEWMKQHRRPGASVGNDVDVRIGGGPHPDLDAVPGAQDTAGLEGDLGRLAVGPRDLGEHAHFQAAGGALPVRARPRPGQRKPDEEALPVGPVQSVGAPSQFMQLRAPGALDRCLTNAIVETPAAGPPHAFP